MTETDFSISMHGSNGETVSNKQEVNWVLIYSSWNRIKINVENMSD